MPRFLMQAQVDLTVLRSGVPDTVPGRSVNVCERGVAAIVAGELVTGESVGVELQLPPLAEPLRTRALVRYQDRLRCGLEFVALSAEQRASIRDWAKEAMATAESTSVSAAVRTREKKESEPKPRSDSLIGGKPPTKAKRKRRGLWWLVALFVLLSAAAIWWWRWNRGVGRIRVRPENFPVEYRGNSARASPGGSDAETAGASRTAGVSR